MEGGGFKKNTAEMSSLLPAVHAMSDDTSPLSTSEHTQQKGRGRIMSYFNNFYLRAPIMRSTSLTVLRLSLLPLPAVQHNVTL